VGTDIRFGEDVGTEQRNDNKGWVHHNLFQQTRLNWRSPTTDSTSGGPLDPRRRSVANRLAHDLPPGKSKKAGPKGDFCSTRCVSTTTELSLLQSRSETTRWNQKEFALASAGQDETPGSDTSRDSERSPMSRSWPCATAGQLVPRLRLGNSASHARSSTGKTW